MTDRAETASLHADRWAFDRTPFRRHARLLAARWRHAHGWPVGLDTKGAPLGSRLPLPEAEREGWNYLTPAIADLVRRHVPGDLAEPGALLSPARLWSDLLSSQPLAFNLFGPLALDLHAATTWAQAFWPGAVVRRVRFEHSPGRQDAAWLGNGTAFDVALDLDTPAGPTLVGIEVKYHEDLRDKLPADKPRYRALAAASGCFVDPAAPGLWARPLWQLWLDHLLAVAALHHPASPYAAAESVLLYPADNADVAAAAHAYAAHLRPHPRVPWRPLTLEAAIAALPDPTHRTAMSSRYLGAA